MPTFKGKDGKPRFSMNPQMGKSMYGDEVPGLSSLEDKAGTAPAAGLDDNGESDSVEIHHGGHPDGQPEPHGGTAYHTIHKGADEMPKEIRNHDDYSGAEAHCAECMGEHGAEEGNHNNDDGDADDAQGGESSSFE